jgi:hypothetical protein
MSRFGEHTTDSAKSLIKNGKPETWLGKTPKPTEPDNWLIGKMNINDINKCPVRAGIKS